MTQTVADLTSDELLSQMLSRREPGKFPNSSEIPDWEREPARNARYGELLTAGARSRNVVLVVQNVFSSPGSPQGDESVTPFIHDALLHMATHNTRGEFPWSCPNGVVIDMCLAPNDLEIHARAIKQLDAEAAADGAQQTAAH